MGTGAHRRRDGDPPGPPRDLAAEAAVLADQAGALLARLENADTRAVNETIILGLRLAELSAALEDASAGQVILEAAYAQGRADEAAAGVSSRSRRGGHLRILPGLPATAVRAAATAAVVAGIAGGVVVAGMHEEASSGRYSASAPRHVLHRAGHDRVVPVPSSSPRPSAAAVVASASPVPVVAPAPAVSSSQLPPPPLPVAAVVPPPPLDVPRLLDLGDSTRGLLPLAVTGQEEVPWAATGTDGIALYPAAGVAVPGQPVTLTVTDPTGNGGRAYITAGRETLTVKVSSSLGVSVPTAVP